MKSSGKFLLERLITTTLNGEKAHSTYSLPYREMLTRTQILARNPKIAAVNIVIYLKDDGWYFPLMARTENQNDSHSGQISLPGGSYEEHDVNLAQTAIRETSEEMGIAPQYIRILRELSPVYIAPSNFYVYPFISLTKRNPQFILQESEASELIEFSLNDLGNLPEIPEMMALPSTNGIPVPIIRCGRHIIWGATSMILGEFRELIRNL